MDPDLTYRAVFRRGAAQYQYKLLSANKNTFFLFWTSNLKRAGVFLVLFKVNNALFKCNTQIYQLPEVNVQILCQIMPKTHKKQTNV